MSQGAVCLELKLYCQGIILELVTRENAAASVQNHEVEGIYLRETISRAN